jgi:hypothetical protein
MELKPGVGIDQLTFGLLQTDVIRILGVPDKIFEEEEEEENDTIYQYNQLKLRLTFYNQEDERLGYIRCANPELTCKGQKLLGEPVEDVIPKAFAASDKWDIERYDFFDTYLNVKNWIVLNVDYEVITEVEIGVPYDDDSDTYEWPRS